MASYFASHGRESSGSNSPPLSASGCSTDLDEDDAHFIDKNLIDHRPQHGAEPLRRTTRTQTAHPTEEILRCTATHLLPSLTRNVSRQPHLEHTPMMLTRQRRSSFSLSTGEGMTPQAILPKTHAPGRRIIPTSINLKILRKQSGSLGSPTVPHSPDSHASTTTPLSPLGGGDSHFGDTIQSNNSTQTGESVLELTSQQSPVAHIATSLPKSRHQSGTGGSGSAHLVSRMATGNRQSAADRSILSWHELEPLGTKVNAAYWGSLMAKVNPQSDDWQNQCLGICDIRRIVVHHPALFGETVTCASRRNAAVNVADVLVNSLTGLADSMRSAVARAAMTALNDVYLFVSEFISGACVNDSLSLCLKKCSGPSGAFIADEALRTAKQIILVADPFRILSTIATILSKSCQNNPCLKAKTVDALAFFALRLDVDSLDLVLAHKDFTPLLKLILKTASDAHPASRVSAARCVIVLLNLVPDLLQKFRSSLTDVDVNALFGRIQRTSNFEIKSYYGISVIGVTYQNVPECACIDLAIERLQTVLANVDMITKHPMPLAPPGGRATTPAKSRTDTSGSLMSLKSRAESVVRTRIDVSTVSGVTNFGRQTTERPSLAGDRLFHTNSPSYTPSRQRQTTLTNRKVSQQYSAHRNFWLQDDDSCEEDSPESSEAATGARAMSVMPARDRIARTPPRRVTERSWGTTPTLKIAATAQARVKDTDSSCPDGLRPTSGQSNMRVIAGQSSQRRMISSGGALGSGATSPSTRDTSLLRRRW